MLSDILLQVALILFTVFMFLAMHDIPRKTLSKLRMRNRSDLQAKRHFVRGAQLLATARSAKTRSAAASIAKDAIAEAEKAILLDPKDAASHILKSLSLDLQGFKTSALDSLDAALFPLAARSLSDRERGDALLKRAELKIALSQCGRVDSAVDDLVMAIGLRSDNSKAFCLLGQCYESKGMKEEAHKAYEEALRVEPGSTLAREGLDRSGS